MQIETISFILGGFLLFVAILGGGIEIKEIKIPRVGRVARGVSAVMGVSFVAISLWTGGFVVTAPVTDPIAQAPVVQTLSVPPVAVQENGSQPALAPQTIAQPATAEASAVPAPAVPQVNTQPVASLQATSVEAAAKPTKKPQSTPPAAKTQPTPVAVAAPQPNAGKAPAITQATEATILPAATANKVGVSKNNAVAKEVPVTNPVEAGSQGAATAELQNVEYIKKIAFTIKAGLGKTSDSTETKTEMRIYLEGEPAATFLLDLDSPSRSVSVKLDKPGKYKYYIEGNTSWDNIPNKTIPMEGKGVLNIKRGEIYELWSAAAPTKQTETWKVELRNKE